MLFNLIGWCIFGLFVGALSRFLLPGKDPMGLLATTGIGIAGSFTMGAIFHLLFAGSNDGMEPSGFIGSVIGAILVLVVLRRWKREEPARG